MKKNERILMAEAKNSINQLIDCLDGIVNEQGYEGLTPFVVEPEQMIEKARKIRGEIAIALA